MTSTALRAPALRRVLVAACLLASCGGPREPDDAESRTVRPSPAAAVESEATGRESIEVRDAAGIPLRLDAPPSRIVSLVPSASETLVALGAGEALVGRTEYDTAASVAHLPVVGGGLDPSPEILIALAPELVVYFRSDVGSEVAELLDRIGIAGLAVHPERIEGIWEMIRNLGRVVAADAAADSLIRLHRNAIAAIRGSVADRPPVTAAFVVGGEPPWVAGPDTFIGELIDIAGGRNVYTDLDQPYAAVSPESFVERSPSILLTVEGTTIDERIVRHAEVAVVSPLVNFPGPRLHLAARSIAAALHPELAR